MGEGNPSAFRDFAAGSQIASYQIVEQVGRGGMAVVYRARDTRLDRWVAVKILAPDLASDQVFRQRFIRESRAAAAVDHQNIIPIFEAGEADGVLFIAMRYVAGQDVRSLLDRVGKLPAARVVGIVTQVADALDAAHAHGLVHRDVKPANMLLSNPDGGAGDHVYLSDFGVSKQSQSSSSLTRTGQLVGTLDYLAPEQVEGRTVDGRTDLYALACAAFEMLCGAPPFTREQSMAVLWAQLSAPPPALTSRCPGLPPAVDQVMAKALAKSPDDRYGTCLGFATALHNACGLGSGGSAEPPRSVTDVRSPTKVNPSRAAQEAPRAPAPRAGDVASGPGGHIPGQPDPEPFDPGWRPVSPPAASPYPAASQPAPGYPAAPPAASPYPAASQPAPGYPAAPPAPSAYPAASRPASPYPDPPRTTRVSPPGPPQPYLPAKRRSRAPLAAGIVIVVLLLAGGAFALLRHNSLLHSTPPGGPSGSGSSSSSAVAVEAASPAVTVRRYIAAINGRRYLAAWRLGGKNSGSTFPEFIHGFGTTQQDRLTIVSVSGNVVTAKVDALQTDGTVQHYQGSYTVEHGVITTFDIQRVS